MKFKSVLKLTMCLVLCLTMFGCTVKLQSISFDSNDITMDINKENELTLSIDPTDYELNEKDFKISDDNIISIQKINDNKLIILSSNKEGSTTISFDNDNIKSNTITIKVEDKTRILNEQKAEEEKKLAEQKKAEEAKKEEQQSSNTTQAKSKSANSTQTASKPQETTSKSSNTNGASVYISATGSKYHSKPKCGNMKTAQKVSLSEAQSLGLDACKKCY